MAEYIKREDALNILRSEIKKCPEDFRGGLLIAQMLVSGVHSIELVDIPDENVQPVVLCKNCIHSIKSLVSDSVVYCEEMDRARSIDGWCEMAAPKPPKKDEEENT